MHSGWTIIVLYKNQSLPTRNLTVWNEFCQVYTNVGTVDIHIKDFITPPTGYPIRGKLFMSASGGASYISGDQTKSYFITKPPILVWSSKRGYISNSKGGIYLVSNIPALSKTFFLV